MNESALTAYEHFTNGTITDGIIAAYGGVGDFFLIGMVLIITIAVQNKTESVEATGLVLFIMAAFGFIQKLPGITDGSNISISALFLVLMVIGLAMPIRSLVKRGG